MKQRLSETVDLSNLGKIINNQRKLDPSSDVALILLAAGKGTRFGKEPKCIQPILGVPLACYTVESFRKACGTNVIGIVGYRHEDVSTVLGTRNLYVVSDQPAGGTGYAVYEAFCIPWLEEANPIVVISMGDRIVPASILKGLLHEHRGGRKEAALTFLTARYEPPKNRGKGRVLRDEQGRVMRIIEENDIGREPDALTRQALQNLTEGNCPLYAIRAKTLKRCLEPLTNDNAQGQFYLTDIIEALAKEGADIRTITTDPTQPEYDLLCSDVTQPRDLALLEGILAGKRDLVEDGGENEIVRVAAKLREGRPQAQVLAVARQLRELMIAETEGRLGWRMDRPCAIGLSGGRLRLAFMHPDMVRFYGPAWQMPIGAGRQQGGEQIVMLAQRSEDRRLHLYPLEARFRESINNVSSDEDAMYPGDDVADWHTYEKFGTRVSETLLLSLGYFSDEELAERRRRNLPLPPASRVINNNLRRPFALVGNAIASMRTLRDGHLGARVQAALGRGNFTGLRLLCTGDIPQGGFSSSSAVTVAVKNAMNSLYGLGVPPNLLVHLACQAEYGTGVRAGSLDQATEQKGLAGQGTLLSSNPADNYRTLGTFPVPVERFQVIFPYSVERDRAAWRWSGGMYGESNTSARLTTGEIRKCTGKAAEIAALLVRLPLETDFFREIEADLLEDGQLEHAQRIRIAEWLMQLPLRATAAELRSRLEAQLDWYAEQLVMVKKLPTGVAKEAAASTIEALFSGWRDVGGIPLRAMVAYLFGEVCVNFHLIHNPSEWIACVSRSQLGDRSVEIDPGALPSKLEMEELLDWEVGVEGPARLDRWLERFGAIPYRYDQGLDDASLQKGFDPWCCTGSFFRGLALIDLAEAMLRRAFGTDAIALRINAAGQGDYFQVHIDRHKADPEAVQAFLRGAFYRRFGLNPKPEFVETNPGGGALGVQLSRFDKLPALIAALERGA